MYGYHQRPFSNLGNSVVGHVHHMRGKFVVGQTVTQKVNSRYFLAFALDIESQYLTNVFDDNNPWLQQARHRYNFKQEPILFHQRFVLGRLPFAPAGIRGTHALARGRSHQQVQSPGRGSTVCCRYLTFTVTDIACKPPGVGEVVGANSSPPLIDFNLDDEAEPDHLVPEIAQATPGEKRNGSPGEIVPEPVL